VRQDKVSNFNGSAFRTSRNNKRYLFTRHQPSIPKWTAKVLADGVVVAFDSSFSIKAGAEDAAKMANSAESIAIKTILLH
jgi:hypothetical protein